MGNNIRDSYIKKIDIDYILSKSDGLNENQKQFFRALANAITERQNDFFDHLESKVIQNNSSQININPIITFLKKDNDNSDYGDIFNPLLKSDEDDENIIFIDLPYNEVDDCERIVIVEGKKCKLEKTDIFIQKEKIISTFFRLYHINLPYIYSPYSRRAFKLYELNEDTNEYEPVNLKRDCYNLSEIPGAIHGELMWNVTITESKQLRPNKTINNDLEFYRYNCDEDSFIVPESEIDENTIEDIKLYKIDNKFIDVRSNLEIDFMKIQINEYKNNISKTMFSSKIIEKNTIIPENIVTYADLKLAIDEFYLYPDEYNKHSYTNESIAVKSYSRDFDYSYNDLSTISRRNKNYFYLYFKDSGIDNFFIDRVNYFIAFMRYNYPNFYWVGVKE